MRVLDPVATGVLARRNPVAKLAAATLPALVLLVSLDPVAPGVLLVLTLVAAPLLGVPPGLLLRRARPLLVAACAVGLVNAVASTRTGGGLLVDLGPLEVSRDAATAALSIALRVAALALPGVLVLATTAPVDLADSLVQQLRAPARFAYGTLAALRLLPLLAEEWQAIAMARRARGFDAGRDPVEHVRLFATQVLALLVAAIRRATRLAAAMDARGFDAAGPRTAAREQRVTAADALLLAGVVAACAVAVAVSIRAGTWRTP